MQNRTAALNALIMPLANNGSLMNDDRTYRYPAFGQTDSRFFDGCLHKFIHISPLLHQALIE